MLSNKYNYKLTISKHVFFQDGEEYPVDVPYLFFQADGNVTLQGSDDVGEFNFSGRAEEDYMYLKKEYVGQHTVFYVGKLDGNVLNLWYSFEEDEEAGKQKVDEGEKNALMEFESDMYSFYRNGFDCGDNYPLFLRQNDSGKRKGLSRMKGKTCKLSYKEKDEGKGKLQMQYKEYEKTFKVNQNGFDLIVDSQPNNQYKLEFQNCQYVIDGMEYSFYLPYLNFFDDGSCEAIITDNNGEFTINGFFEGEHLYLTKSYNDNHKIYLVGKFNGARLELAYCFEEGQEEDLKAKLENNEWNAYCELTNDQHYYFEMDELRSHTFLHSDDNKHKGFCIHDGLNYLISLKTKEGKKTKLKMKRDKEVRYVKVDIDHEQFLILLADKMPMGMGL